MNFIRYNKHKFKENSHKGVVFMADGNKVAETIDGCIATLQTVKKQWSRCVKCYIDIETNLMADFSKNNPDDTNKTLGELRTIINNVTTDRANYKEHYNNILKNCTLGGMLTWAVINDKREKLERVIENSKYYQDYKAGNVATTSNDSSKGQMSSHDFFDYILENFGKIKYKKIGKGDTEGESGFLISLMVAVFDSILKAYIGLANKKGIDKKTRYKMDFGGIKGKDIEKYICKVANISEIDSLTKNKSSEQSMLSRLDSKRENVGKIKNAISIKQLCTLFKEHKITTKTIADETINTKSEACIKELERAKQNIEDVRNLLNDIILE